LKIQVREILRAAKRQGVTPTRNNRNGAREIVMRAVNANSIHDAANKLGVKFMDMIYLEAGFEGWDAAYSENRYYKVGRRLAAKLGLPPNADQNQLVTLTAAWARKSAG
jgi:predicted xylose isomerase-like sugar epimerase